MTEVLQQEIRTLKDIFESERDPEGRAFAPLADAFRRAGEIQQAVRVLNEGLARHPQFVPGHVVAARLYVEQGLAEEAAIAARSALELDGENSNALRSLLAVLEEQGDDEAEDIRARLITLEPDFSPEGGGFASATPPPAAEAYSGASVVEVEGEGTAVDAEAETVERDALEGDDQLPALQSTTAVEAAPLDLAPVPELAGEEPVIDLDLLGPVNTEDDVELAVEEPMIDLDALAPVSAEEEVDDTVALAEPAPEYMMELPTEEPVIDLDQLAPVDVGEEDAVASFSDLAPEPEEDVMALADLAPEPEEDVMALADLAPEPEEDVIALADLAPEPEEDVMALADLAPEPEEDVMALADLAPEPEEDVIALADLAPEPEEDVMALADLAPEPEEDVMALADLAPEPEEDVIALADLAPEPEEEVIALADLAPEPEEEVMALADLAPEPEEEVIALADLAPEPEEDAVALADLAPEPEEPVMDLTDLAPESEVDDVVIDMDALKPSTAEVHDGSESDDHPGTPAGAGDEDTLDLMDEGPGEPVYTRTLGELYVKQGAIGQAIEVFRHLSDLDPSDAEVASRLEELESGVALGDDDGEDADPDEEVEALARDLAEGGHGEHDVESPFAWTDEGDGATEEADSGPTIGDYFEGLLNWKPGGKS